MQTTFVAYALQILIHAISITRQTERIAFGLHIVPRMCLQGTINAVRFSNGWLVDRSTVRTGKQMLTEL